VLGFFWGDAVVDEPEDTVGFNGCYELGVVISSMQVGKSCTEIFGMLRFAYLVGAIVMD
jgi:hypothetical protein